jgi:hypothetical protein
MDFMLRFAKALALVLALGASVGVRAEVVISGGGAGTTGASPAGDNDTVYSDPGSGFTTAGQFAGFSFLTTGSSAANGQWALTNLKFNLKADTTGVTTLNNYTLRLFEITGSNTLSGELYSKSSGALGTTISNSGTGDEFSRNLLGSFGTVGGTGLEAGKNYYMSFAFDFVGDADVWIQGLDPANQVYTTTTWNPTGSYSTQSSTTTLNEGLNASVAYAYSLEAVAVPEPGTLLLGGIAAVGGAGGWWARRRKKAAAANAVAEGEQAATV